MGRPINTKNKMRNSEEKQKIILEYLGGNKGLHFYASKYDIGYSVLHKWYNKYQLSGIEGLKSQTGKNVGRIKGRKSNKFKTKEAELELIIMKQEIEIERLKKGYIVKGVGGKKEYVTTLEKNTK